MHRPLRVRIGSTVVALACLAGVAAGCSDSKDDSSAAASKQTTTTQPPKFEGSPDSEVCRLMAAMPAGGGDKNPEQIRTSYQRLFELRDQLVKAAPDGIRHDMEVFIDGYREIDKALSAVNYDRSKLAPEKLKIVQDPAFISAATRVGAYASQVCDSGGDSKAEPDGPGSAPTEPPATTETTEPTN